MNNDSVSFSDNGTTSNPTAGATTGTITSEDIEWDSLGSAQPPEPYASPGDLAGLVLGEPPMISHGDSNGDSCTVCHESGSGGAPVLTASHLEAGLDDTYCRNCHTNAS